MATTDNKDKKDSFYALFKEILETQNQILSNQAQIKESIAKLADAKKQEPDWGNI